MYPISATTLPIQQNQTKQQDKHEKIELTRAEIISSKDLTPEQKMEKLGIKPMTATEMATRLADKIIDGEV